MGGAWMRVRDPDMLRQARTSAHRTQADVAAAAGVSRGRISQLELGSAPVVSVDVASRVCDALGLVLSEAFVPEPV